LEKPIVWIIDKQQWPRAYLRAELIERGFDARGYEEISEAIRGLRHRSVSAPQVIVLELREQALKREELEELTWPGIPIILLGGVPELNEPVIKEFEWTAVLKRPFRIGDVVDLVEKLAESPTGS